MGHIRIDRNSTEILTRILLKVGRMAPEPATRCHTPIVLPQAKAKSVRGRQKKKISVRRHRHLWPRPTSVSLSPSRKTDNDACTCRASTCLEDSLRSEKTATFHGTHSHVLAEVIIFVFDFEPNPSYYFLSSTRNLGKITL
jgi:hypothetical protein